MNSENSKANGKVWFLAGITTAGMILFASLYFSAPKTVVLRVSELQANPSGFDHSLLVPEATAQKHAPSASEFLADVKAPFKPPPASSLVADPASAPPKNPYDQFDDLIPAKNGAWWSNSEGIHYLTGGTKEVTPTPTGRPNAPLMLAESYPFETQTKALADAQRSEDQAQREYDELLARFAEEDAQRRQQQVIDIGLMDLNRSVRDVSDSIDRASWQQSFDLQGIQNSIDQTRLDQSLNRLR